MEKMALKMREDDKLEMLDRNDWIGIVVLNFKTKDDEKIREIIESIYKKNKKDLCNMAYFQIEDNMNVFCPKMAEFLTRESDVVEVADE